MKNGKPGRTPWIAFALSCTTVAFVLTVGAPPVSADTFPFDLTVPNAAISGFPGPYVSVLVNRTGDTAATITFTSLTQGTFTYLMGDGSSVAVNVNATTSTLSFVSAGDPDGAGTFFTPGPFTPGGSGNISAFGTFNQTLDDFDGFTHTANQIVISLTNTSGTWATAADVLVANAKGFIAAAHIFVESPTCTNATTGALEACATGFASTPEPGTLALFGTGLVSLGALVRKRLLNRGRKEVF